MIAIDVSDATERGYSTGMLIFLAYSGMEALAAAIGTKVHEWEKNDQKLALRLNKLLAGVDLNHPEPQCFPDRTQSSSHGGSWLIHNPWLEDVYEA